MTPNRRHRTLVTLPDGRLWDEAVIRDHLAALDRRAVRPTVARLSREDAEIAAFEARTRGSRAAG